MWKDYINKVWKLLPKFFRYRAIRFTQTKFTVSAGAVVFNEQGEILLLDHLMRLTDSGWGIPGGFINRGEGLEAAVKREIFEETGLELFNVKLVKMRTFNRHVEAIFTAEAIGTPEVKSFEIKDARWFPAKTIPAEMSRSQREIVNLVLSKSQN